QAACSIFQVQNDVGDIPHYLQKSDLKFSSLVGMCSNTFSEILFTDSFRKKVYRISPGKKKLQVLNDSLKLDQPTGIAYSELRGEIWVVETNAHRIAVLNGRGEIIKHIGSRGTKAGEFNYPTHIWIDKSGLVYVVDAMNFRIQVFNDSGEVVSVFGEPGDASGYFARPKGIATDSHGNIYLVDALFHVVQVFNIQGKFLYTLGRQGHGEGEFWMPSGIFIDKDNFVYIADSYNSRIQVLNKLLMYKILLFMLFCWPGLIHAQSIVNTRHNLSVNGPGEMRANSEEEICLFCHTPHSSRPESPLWNRREPGVTYNLYKSSTMQALPGQPDGTSMLCLSCHDGTIALGSLISRSGVGE
ncbi:MAG: 6-bladed beta-propeller, partial [Bacteroidetes bacterium]|nr:6-bladed beta-propeller [Bacteroidota bacterium]